MQQLKYSGYFVNELPLKQLEPSDRVSIIYVHGTAKSGLKIAEIILSQLANFSIHQSFHKTLPKFGI